MMIYFDYFSKWVAHTTQEPWSLDIEMQPQQKIERMGNLKMMVLKTTLLFQFFRFHLKNYKLQRCIGNK